MRKGNVLAALALVAATALAEPAAAQAYVGGTLGASKVNDGCAGAPAGVTCDDSSTAWRILGGYQFHPHFAGEMAYHALGKVSATGPGGTADAKAHAFEMLGVGSLPLGPVSLYGKLGVYSAEIRGGGAAAGLRGSSSDLTLGAGVQWEATRNVGLRAEWQRYLDVGGADFDLLSVGFIYRFQ